MEINNRISTSLAFTLAEVLITLGIIGVIATMTIPILMNNIQDEQFKQAYRNAYSAASQAWLNANTNGNLALCTQWQDSGSITCNADNFSAFKNEMKVAKDCGTNTAECWNMSGEKSWQELGGFPNANAPAFIDNSGTAWTKNQQNPAPEVLVDTNGNKPPNKYGKDRAIFVFAYFPTYKNYTKTPLIDIYPDFPNTDASVVAQFPANEQLNRCPSMATHPCYYRGWIIGTN